LACPVPWSILHAVSPKLSRIRRGIPVHGGVMAVIVVTGVPDSQAAFQTHVAGGS